MTLMNQNLFYKRSELFLNELFLLYLAEPLLQCSQQIERFINSPEAHKNPPDSYDILQQVLRANERHNLCLSKKQLEQIAEDAFRETGNRLQERRHLDLVYNFGSRLTDSYKPSETSDPHCVYTETVYTVAHVVCRELSKTDEVEENVLLLRKCLGY